MELRIASVPAMLEYLSRPERADRNVVRGLLQHEDYQFEMRRYGLKSMEHLVDYFYRLRDIPASEIPDFCADRKDALRDKHALWLDCAQNPQKYYDRYERVKSSLCREALGDLQRRLQGAFPIAADIGDAGVISTLSFGPSFGYVSEGALHLDLFGIERYCSMRELPHIILHEMHHLMLLKFMGGYQAFTAKFTLLEKYIFRFTGEGLAIKFCNNAEGVISQRLDARCEANIGVSSMAVLNRHFPEHLQRFRDTVERLKRGDMDQGEVEEQFQEYWWNPRLYQEETEFLYQTPVYSFGNELFGCIFDHFGLDALFECLYHPMKTIEFFNRTGCGYKI